MSTTHAYRDLGKLHNGLQVLLIISGLLASASLASSLQQIAMLGQPFVSRAAAEANDSRQQLVAELYGAGFLLTMVVFGCWLVRAHRNLRAMGAMDLTVSPGWAVGYFFIPVVNLWMPYQATELLWRASHDPARWQSAKRSWILPAWWTAWIVAAISGRIAGVMFRSAETAEALRTATWCSAIGETSAVALHILALVLILRIASAQRNAVRLSHPIPLH